MNKFYIFTITIALASLFVPYKVGISHSKTDVIYANLPKINYNKTIGKLKELDSLNRLLEANLDAIENNKFYYDTTEYQKHYYVTKVFNNKKTFFKIINKNGE